MTLIVFLDQDHGKGRRTLLVFIANRSSGTESGVALVRLYLNCYFSETRLFWGIGIIFGTLPKSIEASFKEFKVSWCLMEHLQIGIKVINVIISLFVTFN